MPKILINEKDRTSPGSPASYANYSVLITGFGNGTGQDSQSDLFVEPDANGIYEFSSADAFEKTIGLVPVEQSRQGGAGASGLITINHYGNQMAYELLKMGYSVIYKVITLDNIFSTATDADLITKDSFWDIFKDKANYDFRFITHGFLNSNIVDDLLIVKETDLRNAEALLLTISNEARKIVQAVKDRGVAVDVELEVTELQQCIYDGDYTNYTDSTQITETDIAALKEAYPEGFVNKTNYPGLVADGDDDIYPLFGGETGAVESVRAAIAELEATKASEGITEAIINNTNTSIANLARYKADDNGIPAIGTGRGDCIALIELDETQYYNSSTKEKPENLIITAISKLSGIDESNGKYCTMTVPSVIYKMTDHEIFKNKKFPGAFHYLACFMNSLNSNFKEWYAAAGYTRGVSSYTVDYTTVKLGEIAINALEPRNKADSSAPKFACNVIANFRGSYYLWGNRTAHPLGDANSADKNDLVASHFLNIRQLCCTIKKQLYVACRRFTFDPNSDTLWFNFVNAIKPTLEAMKAEQGIRDYKIVKVFTDKKATLKAKIRIIPIEAVEDFDLEVSLEDSFGETAAVVTE